MSTTYYTAPTAKVEGTTSITITAVSARELKNTEMLTKQDPYMTLQMGNIDNTKLGDRVCKTRTHKDGGTEADWGDVFVFEVQDFDAAILTLEVFNEKMLSDEAIGRLRINIKDVFSNNPNFDRQFEAIFKIIDPKDISKFTGDIVLKFLFHNEAAAIAAAAATEAANAAAAAATAEAAAAAQRAQQAAVAAGSMQAYMVPVQNADIYFPPYVPPEVAAFNNQLATATAVSADGKPSSHHVNIVGGHNTALLTITMYNCIYEFFSCSCT